MRYPTKLYVPFESWPKEDRERWQAVLRKGKRLFDDSGTAAHLAEASRVSFRDAYVRSPARPTGQRPHHRGIHRLAAGEHRAANLGQQSVLARPDVPLHVPRPRLVLAVENQQPNSSPGDAPSRQASSCHQRIAVSAGPSFDGHWTAQRNHSPCHQGALCAIATVS
jgi:hypothetical protein